jgi:EsV-1-7 cysteine-rich motif
VHHAVDVGDDVYVGCAERCQSETCGKRAVFGYKGKPPIYCKTCRPEELKDEITDVRNKRCEYEGGCNTRPSFGFIKDRVSATARHDKDRVSATARHYSESILCVLPLLCMRHHYC